MNGRDPPGSDRPPFIGCFRTDSFPYIYDVNRNTIVRVPEETYAILTELVRSEAPLRLDRTEAGAGGDPVIRALSEKGYLSAKRPRGLAPGLSEAAVFDLLENRISHCTLEVTQDCNQDCGYCAYAAGQSGRRGHARKAMAVALAREAIDYYFAHSTQAPYRALSFYGGEPLLAWDLMRACMEHAAARAEEGGPALSLNFTTNATLLTPSIAQYLADHQVSVLVSLDGPEEMHEAFRKFRGERSGTFARTLAGLRALEAAYGSAFEHKVSLNCVYGPWTDLERVVRFFRTDGPDVVTRLRVMFSGLHVSFGSDGFLGPALKSTAAAESMDRLKKRWFLHLQGNGAAGAEGERKKEMLLLRELLHGPFLRFYHRDQGPLPDELPLKGMCIPGVRKTFIDVDGRILACERIPERGDCVLGDLRAGGIDAERSLALLRGIADYFSSRCPDCIFCRICLGCAAEFTDAEGRLSPEAMEEFCARSFRSLSRLLPDWTRLHEKNPACFDYMDALQPR